ncbi:MAG: PASTA domain-containing protein, partial [Planctomyces sp.]
AGRVPDLTGLPHKQALEILQALGLNRDEKNPKTSRVSLQPGQPAATKDAIYTLESQEPKPGTEIKASTRITVRLYTDPSKETKSADRPGARVN